MTRTRVLCCCLWLVLPLPATTLGGGSGDPITLFFRLHPAWAELAQGKIVGEFNRRNPWEALTAYLHLSGNFTPAHQQLFSEFRLTRSAGDPNAHSRFQAALRELGVDIGYISVQKTSIQRVTIGARSYNRYSSYTNCQNDAFTTATETLLARQRFYGTDAEPLSRWISAQLQVFEQCSSEQFDPPSAPDSAWQPLEIHDRNYQIAAAYFYNDQYLEAANRFRQIANTPDSPWRDLGRYLVARSIAREAIINEVDVEENHTMALYLYQEMARNPEYLNTFPSVSRQISFLQVRLDPIGTRTRISQALIESPDSMTNDLLSDYYYFLQYYRQQDDGPFDDTDLGYWLGMALNESAESVASTVERWQSTQSLPWLILAARKADTTLSPSVIEELIRQLETVSPDSPAYFPALRLRGKLLLQNGRAEEAFRLANGARGESQFDLDQRNQLRTLAATASDNWEDYLTLSAMMPLELLWTDEYANSLSPEIFNRITLNTTMFSEQTARTLNDYFTAPMLLEALDLPELSNYLRSRLAIGGWTKAMLASDLDTALAFSRYIKQLLPRLAADFERFENSENKLFEAAWIVITNPAFSPRLAQGFGRIQRAQDNSGRPTRRPAADFVALPERRFNWWCGGTLNEESWDQHLDIQFETDPKFSNLPDAQLQQIRTVKRLQLPSATQFFGPHIIDYASDNLDDPRLPRALHRVVFATRNACSTGPVNVSQQAYALLHRHFPDSEWAEKTPYWFE